MKKSLFTLLIVLFIIPTMFAQTEGVLTVTTTTSSAGGNYSPRNIVAIWVEDESGNFVKTLLAYAQNRKTHLNTWQSSTAAAGSEYNTVDAFTGATKSSHAERSCTWNATDIHGNIVADGNYKLWMELTDKNNTGNFSSFPFTKGDVAENQTPANVPSFSSISIDWNPSTTFLNEVEYAKSFKVYPNPSSGIFNINGDGILEMEVRNIVGGLIIQNGLNSVDLSKYPNGIYLVKLKTEKGIVSKKIVKQ